MSLIDINIHNTANKKACELYWELDSKGNFKYKVSEIAKRIKAKNSSEVTQIVQESCKAYAKERVCNLCKAPYLIQSRTDYMAAKSFLSTQDEAWICEGCESQADERRFTEESKKAAELVDQLRMNAKPFKASDLSLRESAYLLALIRYNVDENLSHILPLEENQLAKFTPHQELDVAIVLYLYSKGFITVSNHSLKGAFSVKEGEDTAFYPTKVAWDISFSEGEDLKNLTKALEAQLKEKEYLQQYQEELQKLAQEISFIELWAYLEKNLTELDLPFKAGAKTQEVLMQILQTHTVAQGYRLIWKNCRKAQEFYKKKNVTKQHAANSVITHLQREYEEALSKDEKLRSFKRDYKLPQSSLSQVVFDFILKTADGGFNSVVSELIAKALKK